MYFVFVKVVAQIAGFVGIVVAGGISVNTGDGFGGDFEADAAFGFDEAGALCVFGCTEE
ncbi:hypothetical protein [Snodgrassella communis]|uniref:hypothetical protein n=1 Tax=Snodgrassella communis TaxID=2946699 RepID=UPI0015D52871|nr:hypothetical protein [Snodgrassella communis]